MTGPCVSLHNADAFAQCHVTTYLFESAAEELQHPNKINFVLHITSLKLVQKLSIILFSREKDTCSRLDSALYSFVHTV